MQKLKYILSGLLALLLYFVLCNFYTPQLQSTIMENSSIVEGTTRSIGAYTLVFCLLSCIVYMLVAVTKKEYKSYFGTLAFLLPLQGISLLLQFQLASLASRTKLDAALTNEFRITYGALYLLPTLFIFPSFVKQAATLMEWNQHPFPHNYLLNGSRDIRLSRFMAMVVDVAFVFVLAFFFSKVIVVYPDMVMMIVAIFYLYHFTAEYSFQTTLGKSLFGLKVVNTTGKTLHGPIILLRTLSRFIPLYPLPILFHKKGIHDYISGTEVKNHR